MNEKITDKVERMNYCYCLKHLLAKGLRLLSFNAIILLMSQ